jgi:hypothetical protein
MENLKLFGLLATTPLVIAQKFGWAFAGIWLLVNRDWAPLIQGILFIFLGHVTLSFALMPSVAMVRFGTTLFTKGGPAKALGSMFIALGGLLHYIPFAFYIFLIYTIIFDNRFLSPFWVVAIWVFSLAGDTFGYLGRREAAASGGVVNPEIIFAVLAADILAAIWGFGMVEQWSRLTLYGVSLFWLITLASIISVLGIKEMIHTRNLRNVA